MVAGRGGGARVRAGMDYLHQVLRKPINDIFLEKRNCELDPSRYDVSKRNSIDFGANRKNLIRACLGALADSVTA